MAVQLPDCAWRQHMGLKGVLGLGLAPRRGLRLGLQAGEGADLHSLGFSAT